jgi:hypothetical protein
MMSSPTCGKLKKQPSLKFCSGLVVWKMSKSDFDSALAAASCSKRTLSEAPVFSQPVHIQSTLYICGIFQFSHEARGLWMGIRLRPAKSQVFFLSHRCPAAAGSLDLCTDWQIAATKKMCPCVSESARRCGASRRLINSFVPTKIHIYYLCELLAPEEKCWEKFASRGFKSGCRFCRKLLFFLQMTKREFSE